MMIMVGRDEIILTTRKKKLERAYNSSEVAFYELSLMSAKVGDRQIS